MTTQIEQIEWHKYPETKPKEEKEYLCVYGTNEIATADWDNKRRAFWDDQYAKFTHDIIAWAEMPKGWQDGK